MIGRLSNLVIASTILLASCGVGSVPPNVEPSQDASKMSSLILTPPPFTLKMDFTTNCLENIPPSQNSDNGLDAMTKRSIQNSQWIKSTLSELGLSSDILGTLDSASSQQFTTTDVEDCGSTYSNKSYVNKVILNFKQSNRSSIKLFVFLRQPNNYSYDTWLVNTSNGQKVRYISSGVRNNIDNGSRISGVEAHAYIFAQNQMFYAGAVVGSSITSSDPSVRAASTKEYGFVIDGSEQIVANYISQGLRGMNIAAYRSRADSGLTAQSLNALGIVVTPVGCPAPNDANPVVALGSASLTSQTILVCPVSYPTFVSTTTTTRDCSNEQYNVDRAERALIGSRSGIIGSGFLGAVVVGGIIIGGPAAWLIAGAAGAGTGFGFIAFAVPYQDLVLDKKKAIIALNTCKGP